MGTRKNGTLADRWSTPEFADHLAEASRMWTADLSPSQFSLRTPDGRADLRGFPFPHAGSDPVGVLGALLVEQTVGRIEWRDVVISDVDFTAVDARSWLIQNCELVNCVFDDADCSDWSVMQSDVTNCSFQRAKLSNSVLGIWADGRGNTFRTVDFTKADLRDGTFFNSAYHDVTFDRARLDRAEFRCSTLDDCHFSGPLKQVYFDGLAPKEDHNPDYWMRDVDFSSCRVDDFQIYNYDTRSVKFPEDVEVIRDAGTAFQRTKRHIEELDDDKLQGPLRVISHWLAQGTWTGGDFAADDLPADLLQLIRETERG